MAGDYSEDIADVLAMITEDGFLVTVEQPQDAGGEPVIYNNVPYIMFPINRVLYESLRRIVGTEVPQATHMGYMPGAVAFVPNLRTVIIFNSKRFSVVSQPETIAPTDVPILYLLQCHEE
jgi:hypothetical protein